MEDYTLNSIDTIKNITPEKQEICLNVLRSTPISKYIDNIIRKSSFKTINSFENLSTKGDEPDSEEIMTPEEISLIIDNYISNKLQESEMPDKVLKYLDEINNLPKKPRKPEEGECCGSGCCPCIWDVYERDLEKHERAVENLSENISDYDGI
jgi:hypothetical protein